MTSHSSGATSRSVLFATSKALLAMAIVGGCGAKASCPAKEPVAARSVVPEAQPALPSGLHFDHFALMVSDLEASARFYGDLLGLVETFDATKKSHIRWFSVGGDRQLHLIQTDSRGSVSGKGVHLALTTQSFDDVVARLEQSSVPFESWPGEAGKSNVRPDGVRQVYLQDPDGYWLELNDASTHWPTEKSPTD